jgi:hypothetical protein
MLLARRASMTILRYVQDAPLKGLTLEYKKQSAAASHYSLFTASAMIDDKGRQAILGYDELYKARDATLLELRSRLDAIDLKLELPQYVVNDKSGVLHRADTTAALTVSASRCTPCGWLYGASPSTLLKAVPDAFSHKRICSRCLPTLRVELSCESRALCAPPRSSSDEDSSDSASSSSA